MRFATASTLTAVGVNCIELYLLIIGPRHFIFMSTYLWITKIFSRPLSSVFSYSGVGFVSMFSVRRQLRFTLLAQATPP